MLISKIITIFVIVNIFTLLQAGTIVVTSTSDSGPGSFRQALLDATSGDEIYFDTAVFPSANPAIIYLTSALPSINQGNLIIMGGEISEELNIVDAGVIIDGSGLSGSEDGLYIDSDRNRIWSLEIRGFYNGISIAPGKSDNIIGGGWDSWGNYIYNNKNNGISVGEGGMNNNIAENIIFGNGHMRIDLGDDGPTFNDAMDADTGTNKLQNFPNPFNPSTHISFTISKVEHVKLEVLNTIGQKLKILVNKKLSAGHHTIQFDATNLSSGVYFYRIEAGGIQDVKKMILLR